MSFSSNLRVSNFGKEDFDVMGLGPTRLPRRSESGDLIVEFASEEIESLPNKVECDCWCAAVRDVGGSFSISIVLVGSPYSAIDRMMRSSSNVSWRRSTFIKAGEIALDMVLLPPAGEGMVTARPEGLWSETCNPVVEIRSVVVVGGAILLASGEVEKALTG
jgi:hypothetical protein